MTTVVPFRTLICVACGQRFGAARTYLTHPCRPSAVSTPEGAHGSRVPGVESGAGRSTGMPNPTRRCPPLVARVPTRTPRNNNEAPGTTA